MKLIVISDSHGNREGIEKIFENDATALKNIALKLANREK